MLYSIVVKLRPEAEATIAPTQGYHAYAMFLDILRRSHPETAQQLHDLDGAKPFTISPLEGRFRREKNAFRILPESSYRIRFTFLEGDTFSRFLDAAMRINGQTLRLDQAELTLHEIITTPEADRWCDCRDAQSLLNEASDQRRIRMEFCSPTVFRSKGKRNVLFPEPRLFFQSWLLRWQGIYPETFDIGLIELAEKATRISEYRLETRILQFGSYREIGFQGKCTIDIAGEISSLEAKALNALSDFAFFCGTGAKTSMGMGQTRRLKSGGALSG